MPDGGAELKLIFDTLRSDLREAVSGVLGSIDLAQHQLLTPGQRENWQDCRARAHEVLRILDDILVLSSGMLAAEASPVTFSPAERVRIILELLEPLAERSDLVLEAELESTPPLHGDAAAFEHVATRMLEYAIRSARGGTIRIALDCSGGTLWFSVVVLDARPTAHGDDLTLHLARAVVRKIGGRLDHAHSGRQISIQASIEARLAAAEEDSSGSKFRVLVAEASEEYDPSLSGFLREQLCLVDRAGDGEQAVALATQGQYDMIFLDIEMPKLDGHEATRTIREWETLHCCRHVPIVALSDSGATSRIRAGGYAGCSGYLRKPVTRSAFLDMFHRFAPEGVRAV